ncbi:S1/P1 nuclease [Colwellia maritima]|uniref:S1/P1 nuclease n=1 Tax=Colwellia maritima TaxID=2912588 RepID=UPI00237B4A5F|nr:S1/P1 nuclease [Colwellia maritima]
MTKFIAVTVFILLYVVSTPKNAMGKLGHQIVCQLAFEHLSETNQNKITALLKDIPTQHKRLINHYNYKKEDKPITFDNACTWADAIKRIEEYRSYNAWHYLNVTRASTHISENECSKNCLPQAIITHQKRLANPQVGQTKNEKKWLQIQSLMFLGHWLGDIHQPLHISFADDMGGNKVKFSHFDTKCGNLHWYWDECIFYKEKKVN